MDTKHGDVKLDGDPGWIELPRPPSAGGPSFVSGEPTGDRLRVRYFRRNVDGELLARVWFGPGTEGPPGHAHGGAIAAVLDEAMGAAAWVSGHMVVAVKLTVNFEQMVPIGTVATIFAAVEEADGRKVRTKAHLAGDDGLSFCTAEALFITLEPEKFGALAKEAMTAIAKFGDADQ